MKESSTLNQVTNADRILEEAPGLPNTVLACSCHLHRQLSRNSNPPIGIVVSGHLTQAHQNIYPKHAAISCTPGVTNPELIVTHVVGADLGSIATLSRCSTSSKKGCSKHAGTCASTLLQYKHASISKPSPPRIYKLVLHKLINPLDIQFYNTYALGVQTRRRGRRIRHQLVGFSFSSSWFAE